MERWFVELDRQRPEAAWDAFLERYRRLIFATIRRYVDDHDDVMDAFTWVCEGLRADDFRRLRSYRNDAPNQARFTTWLVTVVRNLTVDWLRARDGRRRQTSRRTDLSELQSSIHEQVFTRREPHVRAYELVRSRSAPELTFGRFLRELATVYRVTSTGSPHGELPPPLANPSAYDGVDAQDTSRILHDVLDTLPAADRLIVQMYVIDELPAAEVARMLDLSSAKTVYNRVYRALAVLRDRLEQSGLDRDAL